MENRYDIAKIEYQNEDEDGKHRLVYAYFGLAIYTGQCMEEVFSIMLWTNRIFKQNVKTNLEVNEIIDSFENSKKTMGYFINEVKHSYSLTNYNAEQLDKILVKRNYLAHKYFKKHIEKFYSEMGRLEMIKYFCDFIAEAQLLEEQLTIYYSKYTKKMGMTEERITNIMTQIKKQELIKEKESKLNNCY